MAIWKTLRAEGGVGVGAYACVWVLLAEVNLWVMGFSSMSLVMLRLRRGGEPPRSLER